MKSFRNNCVLQINLWRNSCPSNDRLLNSGRKNNELFDVWYSVTRISIETQSSYSCYKIVRWTSRHIHMSCKICDWGFPDKPVFTLHWFSAIFRIIDTLFTCLLSHSYLTDVSAPDLSQIWMWFPGSDKCFCSIKMFFIRKLTNGTLVTPKPWKINICPLYQNLPSLLNWDQMQNKIKWQMLM